MELLNDKQIESIYSIIQREIDIFIKEEILRFFDDETIPSQELINSTIKYINDKISIDKDEIKCRLLLTQVMRYDDIKDNVYVYSNIKHKITNLLDEKFR